MNTGPYAHTLEKQPPSSWEPLGDHLDRVAELASRFASAFDCADWGRLAGRWHDLGKFSEAFQNHLMAHHDGHRADVAGRVDHSTAGAQHVARLGSLGRVLAYCIAGHHAGLPDGEGTEAALSMRLKKRIDPYDSAPPDRLLGVLPAPPKLHLTGDRLRAAFSIAFFTRMLFSCLVDADFLATEEFMDPRRASRRPCGGALPSAMLARLNAHLAVLQDSAPDTDVNRQRRQVLDACRKKAQLRPGLFSLNVPTGGGKTLSSLAFALTHAVEHGLDRVVYAIPFTSIIEQTADVFRGALGDLADEVLEHHSNLEPGDPKRQSERSRLAAENFDAGLTVTTNVQLFESLFASRTSRCRKLHRLTRSVIILDEAQTLPPNLLAPTLSAIDELVLNYGATVVLCTATQPAFEKRHGFSIGVENVTPIIDDAVALHGALRRVRLNPVGELTNERVRDLLAQERQVLCIVNSRRHASELFKTLSGPGAFHLSASMCGAHRSTVITEIRRRLKPEVDAVCRVVSTQVIEAGVDVDFPSVFRATAGLDSIAQAAGRCNREGTLKDRQGRPQLGNVVVFDYDEHTFHPPPLIRSAAGHFREIMAHVSDDLLSPSAVEAYFRLHYWQQGGDHGRGWDRGRENLSVLRCFGGEDGDPLHHQFRQAANRFRMIDDAQTPILVPYGHGRGLIRQLQQMTDAPSGEFDRSAQRYVVSVFDQALRRLSEAGVLIEQHGRYYLATEAAYDSELGLLADAALDAETLVQ